MQNVRTSAAHASALFAAYELHQAQANRAMRRAHLYAGAFIGIGIAALALIIAFLPSVS